jgi:hypothetical protein
MRLLIVAMTSGLGALVTLVPVTARGAGGEAGELEHARANARAGGLTNWRDAELLDRWGCLSGTKSEFCEQRNHRSWSHSDHRRAKQPQ